MELLAAQREFTAYGPSHLIVLAVFAIGAALLIWGGRRQTEAQARLFSRGFAVVILAMFLVALTYKLLSPVLTHQYRCSCAMSRNSLRSMRCGRNGIGRLCSPITGASCSAHRR